MLLPINKTTSKSKDLVIFSSTMYNVSFSQDNFNAKKKYAYQENKPKTNGFTHDKSNFKKDFKTKQFIRGNDNFKNRRGNSFGRRF